MRIYPLNRYVAGARKATCDRCGFDFLSTELIEEERTGLMVCSRCYDPVHPQDLKPLTSSPATNNGNTARKSDDESTYVDSP
jgi:protein-arginine kinase activator protein McsA